MKYVFGPVPSRRLGLSLGVDIIPFKTCTLDCVYCECGPTIHKTLKRKRYVKTEEVLAEIKEFLNKAPQLDYITFSGSGEPTLNSDLGKMILEIKKITRTPVAVLTNGTLLNDRNVKNDLALADVVLPSLDAVSVLSFLKVDRPHKGLKLPRSIKGLIDFRKIFSGQIWLEIFFVEGMNDRKEDVQSLIQTVKRIRPDKVQLNSVDRPPAVPWVRPVTQKKLEEIAREFSAAQLPVEIIKKFDKQILDENLCENDLKEQILNFIKRRPETKNNMAKALHLSPDELDVLLNGLIKENVITVVPSSRQKGLYYKLKNEPPY